MNDNHELFPEMRAAALRPKRRRDPVPRGHAWKPGTGPEGETCKTCAHRVRLHYHNKVYQKCGKNEAGWTHGRGSDIRVADPACKFWEKDDD